MKKITWILFTCYFCLFAGFGLIFYFKYLNKFFKTGAEPQPVETAQNKELIYYSQDNNLYRFNPALNLDPLDPNRFERFQSTGEVSNIDISKNNSLITYDSLLEGVREIWEVKTENNASSKIASSSNSKLNIYKDFSCPKYSPDGTQLAFIANNGTSDKIIIYNLATLEYKPLSDNFVAQISDYVFSPDSQSIIFCTSNALTNTCYLVNIKTGQDSKIFQSDILQLAITEKGELIYLKSETDTANIYRLSANNEPTRITNLKAPKKISKISTTSNGNEIAYEVNEDNISNIYFINSDGSNNTQLTTDGNSLMPQMRSFGGKIAYFRAGSGIYQINTNKSGEQKIANIETIINLLIWR